MAENMRSTSSASSGTSGAKAGRQGGQSAGATAQQNKPPSQSGDTAKQKGEAAKQKVGEAARQAQESLQGAGEAMADQASEAAASVRRKSREFAHQQKERLTTELDACSVALKDAADRYNQESETNLGRYAGAAAEQLDRAKSYFETRDMERMLDDAENAVRDHRELVYGACFIAGLGLARFLKASARRQSTDSSDYVAASSHGAPDRRTSGSRPGEYQAYVEPRPTTSTTQPTVTTPQVEL